MRYGNRDRLSGHTGGEICHFKLLNYLYITIMWWERTQFSNSTFWRLVFSHSWFRIHLQLDFVSLEMHYEPLVWEHQSPKCFGGEPTSPDLSVSCGLHEWGHSSKVGLGLGSVRFFWITSMFCPALFFWIAL